MLFKYLSLLYLKHIFFILFALVLFFVGFDYILSVNDLPEATNLRLLYVSFKGMEAVETLWLLSLVFAFITSWIALVRANSIVSFFSLGYKKRHLLLPFVTIFALCYGVVAFLHTTEFSYAKDKSKQIRNLGLLGSVTSFMFFKYDDNYVYIERLFPLQKKAVNIRIFKVKKNRPFQVIEAPQAFFNENHWVLPNAKMIMIKGEKVATQSVRNHRSLKGFKPKVLESVYENGAGFSLSDAYHAINLLRDQGVKTDKIRAIVYHKLLIPFFALFLIGIFFYKLPLHLRFANLTVTLSFYVVTTLFTWGVFLALYKVSVTGVVTPEVGIILPLAALLSYLIYVSRKSTI